MVSPCRCRPGPRVVPVTVTLLAGRSSARPRVRTNFPFSRKFQKPKEVNLSALARSTNETLPGNGFSRQRTRGHTSPLRCTFSFSVALDCVFSLQPCFPWIPKPVTCDDTVFYESSDVTPTGHRSCSCSCLGRLGTKVRGIIDR
ncbi:hypothetical protein MPTK1_4g07260 [Marchantia polymorpha subsp. ruderalis]|uniref:Uncharacterized protein n=2 Tax=Marchantia polymorpha TaxID=3197 RepID=A0AAF6B7D1_MARPO|nr:hypothetical protein MARPO_0115s0055 [Marchantia polymorpha]BBN07915.1 hypothetical protein Mp_4g07260 [Marchantia polymorpha subsp. ruderalis]|eukprot:PTQ31139.1 hypothetical protein MARPO_0115s0055 [Marchantia polymorpha]